MSDRTKVLSPSGEGYPVRGGLPQSFASVSLGVCMCVCVPIFWCMRHVSPSFSFPVSRTRLFRGPEEVGGVRRNMATQYKKTTRITTRDDARGKPK